MQYPHQPPADSNTPIQPYFILGAPCTSWEKTRDALIFMGVPHNELGRWHSLYICEDIQRAPKNGWEDIQRALQDGWDPKEEIEKHLTPFFEPLGARKFRCIAPVRPGEVCGWVGTKKDRTISHICGHLDYNAYICSGHCRRDGCKQRFAEKRNLDQHLKSDPVQCSKCNKTIEHKRNLTKHMDSCRGLRALDGQVNTHILRHHDDPFRGNTASTSPHALY